jgi:ABC-type Fe3+/spermidine/putrescine transport system ATPase subunit
MLELKNITHFYGNKTSLENFSLQAPRGEITCLLGSSGCGKTTALRLIAGLEIPSEGEISINGKTVSRNGKILVPPHERNIGFIFQDLALWPHFTVLRNVAFGLNERKISDAEKKARETLALFGLQDYAEKFPHQLSGGQKQLAAIARALALEPKILLMDEPLANLDVKLKRKILTLVKNLKTDFGLTIVYVTHDHREAFALADKIAVIDNGKVIEFGTPQEIKRSENEFVKYFLEY